jgi:hypothetical protein
LIEQLTSCISIPVSNATGVGPLGVRSRLSPPTEDESPRFFFLQWKLIGAGQRADIG